VVLIGAPLAMPVPVPPFGRLHLDLTTAIVLPPLSIPGPFGAAEAALPVPAAPRLVGAALAAQALVLAAGGSVGDLRLTNAQVLVIPR
jgi:hypothetical protein